MKTESFFTYWERVKEKKAVKQEYFYGIPLRLNSIRKYLFRILAFFLFFALLSPATIQSQSLQLLNNVNKNYILEFEHMAVLEDLKGDLKFSDLKKPNFAWKKPDFQNVRFENNFTLWGKIKVKNKIDHNWLLEFPDNSLGKLTCYIPDENGLYKEVKTGNELGFQNRDLDYKNFLFPLWLPINKEVIIYFKIQAHGSHYIVPWIKSYRHAFNYSLQQYLIFGIIYGSVLIVLIINIFFFIFNKEPLYLYYVFYLIFTSLFSMVYHGIGFQYLWPGNAWLNPYAFHLFLLLSIISQILFARQFLEIKKISLLLDRILVLALFIKILYLYIAVLFLNDLLNNIFLDIAILFIIFLISIKCLYEDKQFARYYTVGYLFFFTGILICSTLYLFPDFHFPPTMPLILTPYYAPHTGFLLELAFLSIAIADKFRLEKKRKDEIQKNLLHESFQKEKLKDVLINELKKKEEYKEKINQQLEQKVKERTVELEESNIKLHILSEQLNDMNKKLDIQNWDLNKAVKEEKRERIISDGISYSEFKKVFFNEHECMNYLYELKWPDSNYACTKCTYTNWCQGKTIFIRVCARCNYPESATANTLLHGVRFPLEKALYLTMKFYKKRADLNISSLSKEVELRNATCWQFIKKIEEYHHEKDFSKLNNWTELI